MPKTPSIYMSRGAYKDGTVFSVLPVDGSGDLDFVRGSDATRINEDGLSEVMTGSTPRFDYEDNNCPSLLIEGESTNLWDESEGSNIIETPIGEFGFFDADTGVFKNISISANEIVSIKLIVKKSDGSLPTVSDDLGQGDLVVRVGFSSDVGFFGNFKYIGNGFYEFELTYQLGVTAANQVSVQSKSNNGVIISRIQVELNNYPTSYIPTSGSSSVRSREDFSSVGLSEDIDSSEGVIYLEMKALSNSGTKRSISLYDTQDNKGIELYFSDEDNKVEISNGLTDDSYSLDVLDFNNYALRYNLDSMDLFVNGEKTETTIPTRVFSNIDSILSNDGENANYFEGRVRDLRIYKGNMTDQELIELTDNGTIIVPTDFPIFFDSVSSKPTISEEVVVLDSRLVSDGNVFTLDTNTGNSIFCFWLPETVDLVSVIDLDALNAIITSSYESELFTIDVVGYDDPIEGKLYTMTQGVPYDNNHRHQITIA